MVLQNIGEVWRSLEKSGEVWRVWRVFLEKVVGSLRLLSSFLLGYGLSISACVLSAPE
jgi:hypothetical protein